MKGKRLTALAMAAMLGVSAVQPVFAADWQSANPLIAHALGEADGKIETNSKEAFITSWQNGFRVVEGDFTYTSDGVLVVRHDFEADGSYYRLEIEPNGNLVMDSKTYVETPAVYEQTPMTAVDLLYLMVEYPDMYLVTDTKDTDKATVQRQFRDLKNIATNIGAPEVLDRIIPQIYNKEMLNWVKETLPAGTPVSLMRQYVPGNDVSIKGLDRTITTREYHRVRDHMQALELPVVQQEAASASTDFVPLFGQDESYI